MRQAVYIVIALALAAVCGAVIMHNRDATSAAQDRIDLLAHRVRVTDTLFRTDSLYFERKLKVAVGKRDTVMLHLTDTILVKAYIAASDTAIRACQSVVLDCSTRVAQRDSIIRLYKSLKPSRISLGIQATCGVGLAARADCVLGIGGSWAIVR